MNIWKRKLAIILTVSMIFTNAGITWAETGQASPPATAAAQLLHPQDAFASDTEAAIVPNPEAVIAPDTKAASVTRIEEPVIPEAAAATLSEDNPAELLEKSPAAGEQILYEGWQWMSNLKDEMQVKHLTLPESHDAGTFNIRFHRIDAIFDFLEKTIGDTMKEWLGETLGGIFAFLEGRMLKNLLQPVINYLGTVLQSKGGQCQNLTIEEQLNSGVRAFDLRFRYDEGAFNIYHGDKTEGYEGLYATCECYDSDSSRLTLEKAFGKIRRFLDTNGDEVIFLKVQNEGGLYNAQVETELKALEDRYGISSDYAMRDRKGKQFSELGEKTLKEVRGQIFDITDAIKDITQGSWEATVADKKTRIQEAVDDYATGLSGEIQCNIQMKLIYLVDPNGECSLHVTPVYWDIFGVKIPHDICIDFNDLFISPKQNSENINPWMDALLKKVTAAKQKNIAENGLGLVSMDFLNRQLCWRIANVNSVNENWGLAFLFVEGGDDEPEEPTPPEEDEVHMDLIDFYNYNERYPIIAGSGQIYGGSGNLRFRVSAGLTEYLGTLVDGNAIPQECITWNAENGTVTLKSEYLSKLADGSYRIGIIFKEGIAYGDFRVYRRNPVSAKPARPSGPYSSYWKTDASGSWTICNAKGEMITDAWLCDDGVEANDYNVWYLLGPDGKMVTDALIRDIHGNYYSLETTHNGYYGMVRYKDGWYDCSGQPVYLQFSQKHDGTFGAVLNADGLARLKAIYGVTPYGIDSNHCVYTASF